MRHKSVRFGILLSFLALLASGCQQQLTESQATEVIQANSAFKEQPKMAELQEGFYRQLANTDVAAWQELGYVAVTPSKDLARESGYCISLTPAGKQLTSQWQKDAMGTNFASSSLIQTSNCLERVWGVPIASPSIPKITKLNPVVGSENAYEVSFQFRWEPNEAGQKLKPNPGSAIQPPFYSQEWWRQTYPGTARIERSPDGWKVTELDLGQP